jgi:flagellar hook-associated protein 3 FlgL
MRVTNALITQRTVNDFNSARELLDVAQLKVTTGHKFQTASEDPTAAIGVMQNDSQQRAITQYRTNIGTANSRVSLEEGTLDQLTSLLTRAKELAVSQATGTATTATRKSASNEANQLLAQAVQLSNTKYGNEYLFGGTNSTAAPFSISTAGPAYAFTVSGTPPVGGRQIEVGAGQTVTANHDGQTVFGDSTSGVLKSLQDLAAALAGGGQAPVTASIDAIDTSMQHAQDLFAETGARANQLQITDSNLSALAHSLAKHTSDLQDIDMETALTELTGRQTAFQAAMLATAKVAGLSLTEYIK